MLTQKKFDKQIFVYNFKQHPFLLSFFLCEKAQKFDYYNYFIDFYVLHIFFSLDVNIKLFIRSNIIYTYKYKYRSLSEKKNKWYSVKEVVVH